MKHQRVLVVVLVLALALAACGGDDAGTQSPSSSEVESSTTTIAITTTTAAATTTSTEAMLDTQNPVDDDTMVVEVSGGDTVAFIRPAGYVAIDLSADDVQDVFNALEEEDGVQLNESLEAVVDAALNDESAEFLYWGFDFEGASADFVGNVNALRLPAGPFDRPEVYLEVLPTQYAELGLDVVSIEEIETGMGPAVKVVSSPPEEWIQYVSVQLLAPTDEWVYSITFSFETFDDLDDALVMKTFESLALVDQPTP